MSDHLFSKFDLGQVLRNHHGMAQKEIDSYGEDYLLNASETDLVGYVVSKVALDVPQLGEAYMLEPIEVEVDVGHDPMWGRGHGQSTKVKGCRVEVRIPFTGDPDLLLCRPSTFTFSPPQARVGKDQLAFIYDRAGQLNPDEIKRNYEHTVKQIREYLQHVETDCGQFHSGLEGQVRQMLATRKNRILQYRQAGLNIGIPLKRRTDAPQTYSVPGVVRKPQIQRPIVKEKSFAPEPTLVESEYENILGIIRSMVSVMERSPREFVHLGEEGLRSHFLVQLNGQYQGRVTGETFNYNGKTDILIIAATLVQLAHGRSALPDNVLFEGGAGETIRRELLKQADVHTLLRLPTGIFYAQGVKANVLFFDRKPAQEKPWTQKLWIYDLRTNLHFTLKENTLKRTDLDDFVKCYNSKNRHERAESERFKSFTYEELTKRDKVNLDIFWLKDDALEESANLPAPEIIAQEITDDLEAALEQFATIADDFKK